MSTIEVVVNLTYEALHHWPGCDIEPVLFLRDKHRHLFYIRCWKVVGGPDRDIELIVFKRSIQEHLEGMYHGDIGTMSCEMLAQRLVERFGLSRCRVLEDGENGAEVTA